MHIFYSHKSELLVFKFIWSSAMSLIENCLQSAAEAACLVTYYIVCRVSTMSSPSCAVPIISISYTKLDCKSACLHPITAGNSGSHCVEMPSAHM